jgi:hypothetical protein
MKRYQAPSSIWGKKKMDFTMIPTIFRHSWTTLSILALMRFLELQSSYLHVNSLMCSSSIVEDHSKVQSELLEYHCAEITKYLGGEFKAGCFTLPPPFLSICIEYSITEEDVHILLECIPLNITPSHEKEIIMRPN